MSIETMAEVSGSISLDFAQRVSPVIVFAKQGDAKTRIINIQPLMNGVPVAIDSTAGFVAKFAEQKPDGYVVYNDSAVINNDGTITVTLSDQSLVAHGKATCCIVLENSDEEKRLTSQNFTLFIEYSAGAYQNLVSTDEITSLEDKLEQIQAMIDLLGDEIRPLPEMSDEDTGKVLTVNADGEASWEEPANNIRETLTITLAASDWEDNKQKHQSASISENSTVICSPHPDSMELYVYNGVMISGAEVGEIEFSCTSVPSADIEVFIHIIDPLVAVDSDRYVPSATEDDAGKVLTVDENGDATWGDAQGMEVYEITSPEEITAYSPDGFYIMTGSVINTAKETTYVQGNPVEFVLLASAWNGTTYTLDITGYVIESALQLGLPAVSDYANTQAVVKAALTIPEAKGTSVIISAVNTPTIDVKVAIFGLALAPEETTDESA